MRTSVEGKVSETILHTKITHTLNFDGNKFQLKYEFFDENVNSSRKHELRTHKPNSIFPTGNSNQPAAFTAFWNVSIKIHSSFSLFLRWVESLGLIKFTYNSIKSEENFIQMWIWLNLFELIVIHLFMNKKTNHSRMLNKTTHRRCQFFDYFTWIFDCLSSISCFEWKYGNWIHFTLWI